MDLEVDIRSAEPNDRMADTIRFVNQTGISWSRLSQLQSRTFVLGDRPPFDIALRISSPQQALQIVPKENR